MAYQPKIALLDLLRRRKIPFSTFLAENGITTYALLLARCDHIGASAPSQAEFEKIVTPQQVSSPTEGVVIFAPLPETEQKGERSKKKKKPEELSALIEEVPVESEPEA